MSVSSSSCAWDIGPTPYEIGTVFEGIVELAELLPQHPAGPGEPCFDGRNGQTHHIADLLVAHGAKTPQQQRLAVRHRQTEGLLHEQAGRIALLSGQLDVGVSAGGLGNGPDVAAVTVLATGTQPQCRPRRSGRPPAHVQRNLPQPGAERLNLAKRMKLVDELHGDILQKVLNLDRAWTVGQYDCGDPSPMDTPQLLLRDTMTVASSLDERLVHAVPLAH